MKEFDPITARGPLTKRHVRLIEEAIGLGAIVFGRIEPLYGAGNIGPTTKCVWNERRQRITLHIGTGPSMIASCSTEQDPACRPYIEGAERDEPSLDTDGDPTTPRGPFSGEENG